MARIKGGLNAKKKHNRTLKLAKGYRGAHLLAPMQEESRKNVSSDSSGSLVSTQQQE